MSSTYNSSIRIRTWNVKGLNNYVKTKKNLNIWKREKIHITLLQDPHLNDLEHQKFGRDWVGQLYYSVFSNKKHGVIILIHKTVPFQLQTCCSDKEGRKVIIKGLLYGEEVVIANLYALNTYDKDYFAQVYNKIAYLDGNNVILRVTLTVTLTQIWINHQQLTYPLKLLILLKPHVRSLV